MDRLPVGRDMGRNGNVAGPRTSRGEPRRRRQGLRRGRGASTRATYYCPVHTHAPLETHGVVAAWEGDAAHDLRLDPGDLRGARGCRRGARRRPQERARAVRAHGRRLRQQARALRHGQRLLRRRVPARASRPGAPVKLMLDRHQEHLCTGNAPSALMKVKLGAKKDGTLTAVLYQSWGSAGVAGGAGTAGPAGALHGKNPNFKAEEYDVFTNAGPAAPLRAPGPLAGRVRDRVGDGRARGQARDRPGRAAQEERGEPGAYGAVRRRRQGDRLGAPQQEGRRHVDGRLGCRSVPPTRRRSVVWAWPTATGTCSPPRTRTPRCACTATARSRSSPAARTSAPATGRR